MEKHKSKHRLSVNFKNGFIILIFCDSGLYEVTEFLIKFNKIRDLAEIRLNFAA
jgi:hypothetical protein